MCASIFTLDFMIRCANSQTYNIQLHKSGDID